ncbi:MAG: DNA repair protein RecN [Anaerolineae bacterium]|nr:DNA repair protein RecN [Anaerolineae bacterium]
MLAELYIRNFAIIDDLRLTFHNGFNVLTGETGAGKSIILDAVMLVLGERADKSMVRAGCDRAYVEAQFTLSAEIQLAIQPLLTEEGLEGDEDDIIVIGREIRANGRSLGRINGVSVNTKLLQEIGDYLVDIHGQGSHLSLLKPKSHLPLLDGYAQLDSVRDALGREVAELRTLQRELASLRQDERAIAQRVEMLTYQIEEISAAALTPGEDDELLAERKRLANAEQLMRYSAEAVALLQGFDDDAPSAVDLIGQAERTLAQLARFDGTQNELLARLQGLASELDELTVEVANYRDALEFNTDRLNQVEERIELINRLKRKYNGSIEAINAYGADASAELQSIENSEARMLVLEAEIDKRLRTIGKHAAALSQKRHVSAEKLARAIEQELGDLNMTARFSVDFATVPDPEGAFVGDERLAFDATGIDRVEFLLSTNPGEPLKPMAKVASGGETARLMLALKTALARVDATPTLIFDEIDQGIGGRIGDTVGRKLWLLATVGNHQVVVVTHLPQMAGYGDVHYHVSKRVEDNRTKTHVDQLGYDARVTELAAMLGTKGEHARGGAADILRNADAVKQRIAES